VLLRLLLVNEAKSLYVNGCLLGGKVKINQASINNWVAYILETKDFQIVSLAGDASCRSYQRIYTKNKNYILMFDPSPHNVEKFISTQAVFKNLALKVPDIIQINREYGLLLLSDFGTCHYSDSLTLESAERLYQLAFTALVQCAAPQAVATASCLPIMNKKFMVEQMNLCIQWYINVHLEQSLTDNLLLVLQHNFQMIAEYIAKQPVVITHMDFHCRNLMVLSGFLENPALGILDFQDATRGPLTYDLVSLLKDCYIAWPRTQVLIWANEYYQQLQSKQPAVVMHLSKDEFIRYFDWTGLQRHLKVLGIFARLYHRDKKEGFLANIPLVLHYIIEVCSIYPELKVLQHILGFAAVEKKCVL